MNPTSVIEIIAYSENEFFTKGFAKLGFQLVTPFENWKESSLFYGWVNSTIFLFSIISGVSRHSFEVHMKYFSVYAEKQNFRTNGSLVWQSDQNIIFDARGGYAFEDSITSLTLSSSLNSTLQELAALAFALNYTRVQNEVHVSFLLQVRSNMNVGWDKKLFWKW